MAKTALTPSQQAEYRRAVERVNKQLYRLEKHYAKTGENLMATAYSGVQRDIKSFFGEQKRFSKSMPATLRDYQKRMNAINRFYSKPSATITGMQNIYGKRAQSWSKIMGAKITSEQMKNVFESGLYKELTDLYGSKTALKKLGMIERQKSRIMQQMEAGKKISFLGAGAKELNEALRSEAFELNDVLRRYYEGAFDQ